MNRAAARAAYDNFSQSTSDKVRQLAFAAIGVVWVMRPNTSVQLPRTLLWAATFAVMALAFDVLQSLYGTIAWGWFHRKKEHERIGDDEQFKAPRQINWPTNGFFYLKVSALVICYGFLFTHLATVLW